MRAFLPQCSERPQSVALRSVAVGAAAAATGAVAAKRAARNLGGFLGLAAGTGLTSALRAEGLSDLVGSDTMSVLSTLVDRLAGPGNTLDDAAARAAMLAVLMSEFSDAVTYEDLEDLWSRRLSTQGVIDLLEKFLIEYVYQRMLVDVGDRIQNGAITSESAHKVERDLHEYIVASVQFEMVNVDPLILDWNGEQGQSLIDRLLLDAYSHLALAG